MGEGVKRQKAKGKNSSQDSRLSTNNQSTSNPINCCFDFEMWMILNERERVAGQNYYFLNFNNYSEIFFAI